MVKRGNTKTFRLTLLVLPLLLSSNRCVFLIARLAFTNMYRLENSFCKIDFLHMFVFRQIVMLLGYKWFPSITKTKQQRGPRRAKNISPPMCPVKPTLMNVGFHTLNVTLTWLKFVSGMEQLNDAQSRFSQLCTGKWNKHGETVGERREAFGKRWLQKRQKTTIRTTLYQLHKVNSDPMRWPLQRTEMRYQASMSSVGPEFVMWIHFVQ